MVRLLNRLLSSALEGSLRVWAAAAVLLMVVERLALVAIAHEAVNAAVSRAVGVAVALGALFAARGAVRGGLRAGVVKRFHEVACDALLDGDVLRASPMAEKDAFAAVIEGAACGARLVPSTLPDLAGDAIASAVLGALLVATQPPRVVAVGAMALLFVALGIVAARGTTERAEDRASSAYMAIEEDLLALLGGRLELVANGRAAAFRGEARARLVAWRTVAVRAERLSAIAGRAPVAAGALGVLVAILIDDTFHGWVVGHSLASAAVLAAAVPSFLGVARGAHEVVRSASQVRPFLDLIGAQRVSGAASRAPLPKLPAVVEYTDVTFAYPGGHPVLTKTSLQWSPGRVLVLAGPNGSGKSTILRLLLGLARPQAGSIKLGGVSLFDLDLDTWRREIAYLPQRPFLSDRATIREAIALLAPRASDATMRESLEKVGVWDALVDSSEAPLDVVVGTLSVGQRQRVALARVLSIDAPVLLLDEPDANLDAAGIRAVRAIIEELAPQKMIAVVAHTDELVDLAGTLVTLRAAA